MFGIHVRISSLNIFKYDYSNQLFADFNIMLAHLLLVSTVLRAQIMAAGNTATVSGGAMPV